MGLFENILGFITDSSKRLSTRATVVILAIFFIVLVDNIIGLSYFYNKQRQLDQLKSISVLLNDPIISQETKYELTELEKQTFKRKNIIEYSILFIKDISWTKKPSATPDKNTPPKRNEIWFLISASGFYIFVTILTVPILLLTDKETPFLKLLASMIMFIIVMLLICLFHYWLFGKIIPDRVFGNWTWNYIINFVLQTILVFVIIGVSNAINKANVSR